MKKYYIILNLGFVVIATGILYSQFIGKTGGSSVNNVKLSFLVEEKNVNQLSKEATQVVVTTVKSVLPSQLSTKLMEGKKLVYTDVSLSVEDVLKGDAKDQLTLRMAGGTIGSGDNQFTVTVEDVPELKVGDRLVLFLGRGTDGLFELPDQYYTIYGGFQGIYKIENGLAKNEKSQVQLNDLISEIKSSK